MSGLKSSITAHHAAAKHAGQKRGGTEAEARLAARAQNLFARLLGWPIRFLKLLNPVRNA